MITPRSTRLLRVPDLNAFRHVAAALACEGNPLAARDRLVVVPTRAAAAHLTRAVENRRLTDAGVVILPDLVTRDQVYERMADRLPHRPRVLSAFEREVLMGVACRMASEEGAPPPFRLRPGLIAEVLHFYDELRRHENEVATFETRACRVLGAGAEHDRGADRLLRQTRFLVAAFRAFEARCADIRAVDEHSLRHMLIETACSRPVRHVIVTVRDRAAEPYGLWTCDFDLLARVPGLERLDLLVTETALAGAWHERLHQLFPGVEDVRIDGDGGRAEPVLLVPATDGLVHATRDREEEVSAFARRVKQAARSEGATPIDRMALVMRRPLAYVYVAREVLRSAGVPCQTFDALPLAAEPYAALLDLVSAFAGSNFARAPGVALLRSPHLRFWCEGERVGLPDIVALDVALGEAGYLGEIQTLERIVASWATADPRASASVISPVGAIRAGRAVLAAARELLPLRSPASVPDHLDVLLRFLTLHDAPPDAADPLRERLLRARSAILGALVALRAAHASFDPAPGSFEDVAATIRRWIEGQTFSPRAGEGGVHLVDADSAPYGDFDEVHLAGLVEGEWPERQRGSIFYSSGLLRELGWPCDIERVDGARTAFRDLLRLPARRLVVSTFLLENDALVTGSPFLDELEPAALDRVEESVPAARIFEFEALGFDPVRAEHLCQTAAEWAQFRVAARTTARKRQPGVTTGHQAPSFSVSALERYQDCPFKFFAAEVLRLEDTPEDEAVLSPRGRGRFIHEVFQAFFEVWDRRGDGPVTPERLDEARAVFAEVAEPLLARLPDGDSSLERTRLFGSAIAMGLVDVVLDLEASRPGRVVQRWLEYRLNGEFTLGAPDRRASLRGVADRIDLLEGHRLRVIDYKSGYAPNPKRALQVPVYALCACERLEMRDGVPWTVDEAAYIAFSGKRTLVPIVKAGGSDRAASLPSARERLFAMLDGVARGEFPPRPHDPMMCGYCAYASVCRKDYVGDE